MNWQEVALATAGTIGVVTAGVHGLLVQRLMIRPLERRLQASGDVSWTIRRLVPLLLHFSTASWLAGGITLIGAALWLDREWRLACGLLIGSHYLYGALANLWATRGRHPGWMMMATALILIGAGIA